jgi:hypothetical protein
MSPQETEKNADETLSQNTPDPNVAPTTETGPVQNEEEEQAPTPFDHPLFMPVLLGGLMFWFGYDGWLNDDPDMAEHITFNRVGFAVLLVGAIYTGITGYKEWKEDQGQ